MFNGKGTYKWPDGTFYEGDWKLNKFNGKGIYQFSNGAVYEGEFFEGMKHGNGT